MLDKLKNILDEYGTVALIIYFSIFGLVLLGFFLAMQWGLQSNGVDGNAGTGGALFAAWVATKATQPLRIGATLLITPLIGMFFKKKSD